MSYLFRQKGGCGKQPQKPLSTKRVLDEEEDEIPLQANIENLKAKLSLKKRYNRGLQEEYAESHKGANQMLRDFYNETDDLRDQLSDALNTESVYTGAFRTHRLFHLALKGKSSWEEIVYWLDDQLGDERKKLDSNLYNLKCIRKKLLEAEELIEHLEKFPYPGSSPWEQKFIADYTKLAVQIQDKIAHKDCASILNSKYKEILSELKESTGKWPIAIAKLDSSCNEFRSELKGLQQMLNDAERLKEKTRLRLYAVEQEFTENRKTRHDRLRHIKKRMNRELHLSKTFKTMDNGEIQDGASSNGRSKRRYSRRVSFYDPKEAEEHRMKQLKAEVKEYQEKAGRLVEVFAVQDLRLCPHRLLDLSETYHFYQKEKGRKERVLFLSKKLKGYLTMIKSELQYSGGSQNDEFENNVKEKKSLLATTRSQIVEAEEKRSQIGQRAADMHTALIGLLELMTNGRSTSHKLIPATYPELGTKVFSKVTQLIKNVAKLEKTFLRHDFPQRNYVSYVKPPLSTQPPRFVYGESSGSSSDEEDHDIDLVAVGGEELSREEIKAKSRKIANEGRLRREFNRRSTAALAFEKPKMSATSSANKIQ